MTTKEHQAFKELLHALEVAKSTIERLQRHAPGSALGTLDLIHEATAKAAQVSNLESTNP